MDISSNYDMNSNHTSKEVKIIAFLLATYKKKIFFYHNLNIVLGNGKKIKIKKRHTSD